VGVGGDPLDRAHPAAHGGRADRARLHAGEEARVGAGRRGGPAGGGDEEKGEGEEELKSAHRSSGWKRVGSRPTPTLSKGRLRFQAGRSGREVRPAKLATTVV